jgi:hypothetical protein
MSNESLECDRKREGRCRRFLEREASIAAVWVSSGREMVGGAGRGEGERRDGEPEGGGEEREEVPEGWSWRPAIFGSASGSTSTCSAGGDAGSVDGPPLELVRGGVVSGAAIVRCDEEEGG